MTPLSRPDPVQKMFHLEMDVLRRMKSPVVSTYINTDNIVFERSGFRVWGWPFMIYLAAGRKVGSGVSGLTRLKKWMVTRPR